MLNSATGKVYNGSEKCYFVVHYSRYCYGITSYIGQIGIILFGRTIDDVV